MKQLLNISRRERHTAPFSRRRDAFSVEISDLSVDLQDLQYALVSGAIDDARPLNVVLSAAAGIIANCTEPYPMLEKFGANVRENLRKIQEQSITNSNGTE